MWGSIAAVGLKRYLLGHLIGSRMSLGSTAHRCSSGMIGASSLTDVNLGSY